MIPLVRAEGVGRRFASVQGEVLALSQIDLELSPGQFVTILGPSGCGKSTLLNLIGLLDQPSSGRLWIGETETTAAADKALAELRRARIGFLFQDAGLIERMSVLDNVMLPLGYRGRTAARAKHQALEAIEALGLEHRTSAFVDTLSGGERQRVGLARILATQPDLIVCDEPTASLDEINSRLVLDHLIAAAQGGALVLCASHDPIVLEQADLKLTMARGQLISSAGRG